MQFEKERWKEELDTYRTVQKTFILEGNVNDIQLINSSEIGGELLPLQEYLHNYFVSEGYFNVIFYNRIDGFYNYYDGSNSMLEDFKKLAEVKKNNDKLDIQTSMTAIRNAMKNQEHATVVVVEYAGQLISSAEHLSEEEIENLSVLMLASNEASYADAKNSQGWANNLLIMITNKVQELPTWFYRYNPSVKVLTLDTPKDKLREQIIISHAQNLFDWNSLTELEKEKIVRQLVAKTDGFTNVELNSILELCAYESIHNIESRIRAYRHGRKENPWEELTREQITNLYDELSKDVLGQPKAVQSAADIVSRAATGVSGLQHSSNNRPRGIMFLAGPTGTGKTELAKSLARNVFGAESSLIRFDMSEYSQGHSDQRLLGAPPGYVGYDAGGELTNAVKAHPFAILLFDEIEKANPTILDKFLQILDDGRMTDSKGETVYFTECIIIFTSNMGISKVGLDGNRETLVDSSASLETIEKTVISQLRLNWRPEILNRIGNNIIVFDYIHEEQAALILKKQIKQICNNLQAQKKIVMHFSEESELYHQLYQSVCTNLDFGGRGIGNVVEHDFLTPISREMANGSLAAGDEVELLRLDKSSYMYKLEYRKINRK